VTQSGEAYVWTSTRGAVSVGDANNGITRQITGVAAGTADTDAVNVAQLKAVESKTGSSNVSLKAGNGIRLVKNNVDGSYTISANFQNTGTNVVAFTPNSTVKLPTTSDTGTSDPLSPGTPAVVLKAAMAVAPTTVDAGAATVIGTRISDDTGELTTPDKTDELSIIGDKTNITTTASGTNLIVSLNKDLAVSSVNVNNGPTINENGIDMNNQKITNVADGTIAEGSREAVNGGQVYQLQNQFSNQVNGLSDRINGLDSRIDKVGAGAAALAALHPTDFDPDNKWDFSMGYGNYRSANAIAVGAYYHPNESTIFSLGTTMGNDNNMVNVGVTFKLGKTGNAVNYSRKAAAKKILQLQAELDQVKKARAAQEAKLNQQQAEIDQMKAQIAQLLAQRQ
jgi:autotransporter adhesin